MVTKVTVKCVSSKKAHTFEFLVRRSNSLKELSIFKRWYNKHMNPFGYKLEFPHHEMQIKSDISGYGELHVHKGDRGEGKGEDFICYVRTLSTKKEAIKVLKDWCLGALIKKDRGLELNQVMKNAKADGKNLKKYAKIILGIDIKSIKVNHVT